VLFKRAIFLVFSRGGHGSGVSESTPAGLCAFLWVLVPELLSKICEKTDPETDTVLLFKRARRDRRATDRINS